jgi:pilus assembly protein Flp/PilA
LNRRKGRMLKLYIARLVRHDDGATMVEYGLMVALIAVVALAAVTLIGTNVTAIFTTIAGAL